jgi:berberine-like enzyme
MRPYVSGFACQNYIDPHLTSWTPTYYGTNYPRLQKLKTKFDPGGVSRFAQGITPR